MSSFRKIGVAEGGTSGSEIALMRGLAGLRRPLLRQLDAAGDIGCKAKCGWHRYDDGKGL